jgi:PAS domain S-box-containing protein
MGSRSADSDRPPSRAQIASTAAVVAIAAGVLLLARLGPATPAIPSGVQLLLLAVGAGGLVLLGLDLARGHHGALGEAEEDLPPRASAEVPEVLPGPAGSEVQRLPELGSPSSAAIYGAILERIGLGVVACGPDGRYTLFNRAACELHGIPPDEALGGCHDRYYELYARDGLTRLGPDEAPLARALRGETLRQEEVMIASNNGWARTVVVNAEPLLDERGLALGAFATVEDVTERYRAERDLRAELERAREADRLKSAFLANMSHEIRTPLNIILGYNTMIAEYFEEIGDSSQRPLLEAIERASRRLMNTVHGILDISRVEVGAFEVHPIALKPGALIERIALDFEDAAASKGLSLTREIEEPEATILFDEHCFCRTLEQLLDNAIKFTESGGVSIWLGREPGGTLALEVRDTGVGIDPRYLPRLFQPFSQEDAGYTRRFEGSGLGLALVKNYVELNHAEVVVESEKGRGSTFRIRFHKEVGRRLPAPEAPRAESPNRPTSEAQARRPAVLVVEDDGETQDYMRAILGKRFEVLLAASGEEARRHLAERADAIRAILMDLSLKGEEDGLSLARSLRGHPKWKDVAVIATTAHAFPEDRDRALAAGCDAFLAKPFSREQLFETLERLVP